MRDELTRQVWDLLGGAAGELERLTITGPPTTLTSRFPVTDVSAAVVGAALLAATAGDGTGGAGPEVGIDTRQLGVAMRSERYLRRDGASPGDPFDPLSAYHRTADGWLRLHANYPWHRAAARRVLDLPDDAGPGDVAAAARHWNAEELETAVHRNGGVAAAVRTEEQWRATPAGVAAAALPLVGTRVLGEAAPRPVRRPRVLDLTRVIAGPVATRTLAAHGAEVVRLDAPDRPELPAQAWETLAGKHSALLDLATGGEQLDALLAGADVVVTGYRPHALDRFGLAPQTLAERFPGLVVVTLSAWGEPGPWAGRRGFDSLVQAACGIGESERRDPDPASAPGALPAQVLDHATGYLGAAAALLALARQRRSGGTLHVRLALAGTASWLQSLPRTAEPTTAEVVDATPWTEEVATPDGVLTLASPPGTVDGRTLRWPAPPPAYGAAPATWPTGKAAT
ncbi:CoA transferase [Pseudonocardia sulfidoxydans NBRC 16205]|uniref:CoA transferase n=1 Tax=Pseudonocardia sulfidoxydans NBRC 16205 TaxID=1223511 RepID=A0A511DLK8_9PSEU|nr:CoA transferase [Pseudonocardia sulfidoxydans]GEL23948.1 CoA transferase [Pseudonocardia sulfidoxydans NBRC 16205]